jgi:hypothetical protein
MKPLAHELINALAELDAKIPGLGLYSCFEYQTPAGKTHPYWKIEWEMALRPRLEALGCKLIEHPVFGKPKYCTTSPSFVPVRFLNATAKVCELRLVRTSMIKVRRYGSGWPDRHQMSADIRIILFLGFDKANRPFHKEMAALEKTSCWTERGISHKSKSWPDAYGREFNVLAACWTTSELKI